jgi:hypothetical protein
MFFAGNTGNLAVANMLALFIIAYKWTAKQKSVRFAGCLALLLFLSGCGGFRKPYGITASFFLPGLLKADPPRLR